MKQEHQVVRGDGRLGEKSVLRVAKVGIESHGGWAPRLS